MRSNSASRMSRTWPPSGSTSCGPGSPHFILEPETAWEREGTVNNVVFPNGAVVIGDTLFVYYGGADTVCGVATAPLRDVLSHVLTFRR